jgi:hypothetical protein
MFCFFILDSIRVLESEIVVVEAPSSSSSSSSSAASEAGVGAVAAASKLAAPTSSPETGKRDFPLIPNLRLAAHNSKKKGES